MKLKNRLIIYRATVYRSFCAISTKIDITVRVGVSVRKCTGTRSYICIFLRSIELSDIRLRMDARPIHATRSKTIEHARIDTNVIEANPIY
mgnify:CR=1 FL=1